MHGVAAQPRQGGSRRSGLPLSALQVRARPARGGPGATHPAFREAVDLILSGLDAEAAQEFEGVVSYPPLHSQRM